MLCLVGICGAIPTGCFDLVRCSRNMSALDLSNVIVLSSFLKLTLTAMVQDRYLILSYYIFCP